MSESTMGTIKLFLDRVFANKPASLAPDNSIVMHAHNAATLTRLTFSLAVLGPLVLLLLLVFLPLFHIISFHITSHHLEYTQDYSLTRINATPLFASFPYNSHASIVI